MNKLLAHRLQTLFDLTTDIANIVPEEHYATCLADVPSNSFGEQLWCMVGTRETCLASLSQESPAEWACSLHNPHNKFQTMQALFNTSNDILAWLEEEECSFKQASLLLALIEHEAQHHGQLIRYIYGNKWVFPPSWTKHYTV